MADETLTDYWTNKGAAWAAEAATQLANLDAASKELAKQQGLQAQNADDLGVEAKTADGIRAQLAAIPMPADGDPLLVALAISLENSRILQGEALVIRSAIDEQSARVDIATAALARAQAKVAEAATELVAAQEKDATWTDWRTTATNDVAGAPVPIPTAADNVLKDATTYGMAKTRVENDLGGAAVPKTLAFLRATEAAEIIILDNFITNAPKTARAKVKADLVAEKGLNTAAAAAAFDLEDALANLRFAATESIPGLTSAVATIASINGAAALTAAEKARIVARAPDVEAKPNLFNAEFFAWAITVPEEAWQRFIAFEELTRLLSRIKALDITTPVTGIVDASKAKEKTLTTALSDAAKNELTLRPDEDAATLAQRIADSRRSSRVADLVGAIRGDGKH